MLPVLFVLCLFCCVLIALALHERLTHRWRRCNRCALWFDLGGDVTSTPPWLARLALHGHGLCPTCAQQLKAELCDRRAGPDALEIQCEIYCREKKWEPAVQIAEAIIKLAPERFTGWVFRSFALHELRQTQEAFDLLRPVWFKFPEVWTIPYNLACYCAQLGRLEECEHWFKRAMAIDEQVVKRKAIDDPDLKPLRDSMSGTIWKRE